MGASRMKPAAVSILSFSCCVLSGCASQEKPRRASGAEVATAVMGGALIGAVAFPIVYPIAAANGQVLKEEAEAQRRVWDPIYAKRIVSIRARDCIGDVMSLFEAGCVALLPAIPNGAYYPGLERESFAAEKNGLPSKEENLEVIRRNPVLSEIMELTANDPLHPKGDKPPFYFSEVYREFQRSTVFYKSVFNEAMYRRMKEKAASGVPQ